MEDWLARSLAAAALCWSIFTWWIARRERSVKVEVLSTYLSGGTTVALELRNHTDRTITVDEITRVIWLRREARWRRWLTRRRDLLHDAPSTVDVPSEHVPLPIAPHSNKVVAIGDHFYDESRETPPPPKYQWRFGVTVEGRRFYGPPHSHPLPLDH